MIPTTLRTTPVRPVPYTPRQLTGTRATTSTAITARYPESRTPTTSMICPTPVGSTSPLPVRSTALTLPTTSLVLITARSPAWQAVRTPSTSPMPTWTRIRAPRANWSGITPATPTESVNDHRDTGSARPVNLGRGTCLGVLLPFCPQWAFAGSDRGTRAASQDGSHSRPRTRACSRVGRHGLCPARHRRYDPRSVEVARTGGAADFYQSDLPLLARSPGASWRT